MKLLILTQKVDREDPILGFFHGWIEKLSRKYEKVSVICLEKGQFDLPQNVKVYSLGKEVKRSKLKYLKNFFNLILGLHKEYDIVFVHMNQEYVLLGGFIWKIMGKKIFLWRNHLKGNLLTRIAVLLSNKVFCTSSESFTARFKKTILMPVGIDTEQFQVKNQKPKVKNSILFLGRIAPVKNVDLFIDSLKILKKENIEFTADIYGDALPKDAEYFENIKKKVENSDLNKNIYFHEPVANYKTPEIYNNHQIFVNLTPSGSFDKAILEAAACGCITIAINKSLEKNSEFAYLLAEANAEDIADKITLWFKADTDTIAEKSQSLQNFVIKNHSLNVLVEMLVQSMQLI